MFDLLFFGFNVESAQINKSIESILLTLTYPNVKIEVADTSILKKAFGCIL